jgi:mannose-P-dolichol utilization defect protein 1
MDVVRSTLQPITHNLPAPIANVGISLLGETCYKTLVLDIDPSSVDCIKLAISKGLGIGIIAASATVKIPQILKIRSSKSSEGISFLSYLLESTSYLISLAYNYRSGFPFSTYGETSLILLQNLVISVLVLQYSGRQSTAALFVAGFAMSTVTLFQPEILNMEQLSYLQAGAGVLSLASKVPQILSVWSQGGTGQLSAFAVSFPSACLSQG